MDGTVALNALEDPVESPAPVPVWDPPDVPGTVTGALLDQGDASWPALVRRLGAALALSSAFGIALGMRRGGIALLWHGAGVPLGFAVVAVLVAPAFFIGLLHVGVRVEVRQVADALSRAAATSGLVLAGLSPLAALVVVSSEDAVTAAAFGWLGLALGGALGFRQLNGDLARMLASEAWARRIRARLMALGFALVSALLAARVWGAALRVLGGAP